MAGAIPVPATMTFKHREPCNWYWGNTCTGFGGTTDCTHCGWTEADHKDDLDKLNKIGTEGESLIK